jgi:hypothetical protein
MPVKTVAWHRVQWDSYGTISPALSVLMAGDVGKMGKAKRIIHVDFVEKAVLSLPWLDEREFPLSEKRMKLRSKHWTPKIWEAYLHSLEVPQREPVGLKKDRAVILTEHANSEDGLEASTRHLYEYEPERHQWIDRTQSLTSNVCWVNL